MKLFSQESGKKVVPRAGTVIICRHQHLDTGVVTTYGANSNTALPGPATPLQTQKRNQDLLFQKHQQHDQFHLYSRQSHSVDEVSDDQISDSFGGSQSLPMLLNIPNVTGLIQLLLILLELPGVQLSKELFWICFDLIFSEKRRLSSHDLINIVMQRRNSYLRNIFEVDCTNEKIELV